MAQLRTTSHRSLGKTSLPSELLIAKAAVTMEQLLGDGGNYKPPAQADSLQLWHKLNGADQVPAYELLTDKDWRDSPWCLWLQVGDATPLARRTALIRRYGQWLTARQRQSDYRRLVQAWLLHFADDESRQFAVDLIATACLKWPEWLWAMRHAAHELFDVKQGPARLASRVMDETQPASAVLREHGLGDWLQTGGYGESALAVLLADLPRRLRSSVSDVRTQNMVQRTLEWAENSEGALQFPKLKVPLAEALLLPWVQSVAPKSVEKTTTAFLLKTFGDPRLQRMRWSGVSEAATNVLKRWLTGATLEAFIRIIERVAEDGHWRYRKAFWMAYYRAGHVLDAWIAMGPEGEAASRRFTDLQGQFGKLTGQRQSNHSVLIMRIGNLVIADWSHSGKCRIWNEGDRYIPALYQRSYDGSALRAPADFEIAHHSSASGGWQRQIHDHIRGSTGIRVSSASYLP